MADKYVAYDVDKDPLFLKGVVDKEQFMHAPSRPLRAKDINMGEQIARTDYGILSVDGLMWDSPEGSKTVDGFDEYGSNIIPFVKACSTVRRWGREFKYNADNVWVGVSGGKYVVLCARLNVTDDSRVSDDYDYYAGMDARSAGMQGSYGVEFGLLVTDVASEVTGSMDSNVGWTPIWDTRMQVFEYTYNIANIIMVLEQSKRSIMRVCRVKINGGFYPVNRGGSQSKEVSLRGTTGGVREWFYVHSSSIDISEDGGGIEPVALTYLIKNNMWVWGSLDKFSKINIGMINYILGIMSTDGDFENGIGYASYSGTLDSSGLTICITPNSGNIVYTKSTNGVVYVFPQTSGTVTIEVQADKKVAIHNMAIDKSITVLLKSSSVISWSDIVLEGNISVTYESGKVILHKGKRAEVWSFNLVNGANNLAHKTYASHNGFGSKQLRYSLFYTANSGGQRGEVGIESWVEVNSGGSLVCRADCSNVDSTYSVKGVLEVIE